MNGKLRVWWSVLGLSLSAPAQIIGPVTAPDPGLIYDTQEGSSCISAQAAAGAAGTDFGARLGQGNLLGPTTGADLNGAMIAAPNGPTAPGPDSGGSALRGPHRDPPGYGTGFALAKAGTVALTNGAFVTPMTLLAVPSDVGNMGLLLRATYRSDASSQELAPFGPGWFLSGYDFLKSNGEQQAGDPVTLLKGTGEQFTYTWNGSSYVSPDGSFDVLEWTADPQAPLSGNKFSRLLPDGRRIWYVPVQVQGLYRWVREKVVDLYGNQITYAYDNLTSWPAKQTSITDARGVRVVFTWTGSVITDIHLDTSTLPNLDPQLQSADDVKLLFEYGTSSLLEKIRFFPTTVVRDVNGSGFIELPGEQFDSTRPAVQFVYGAPGSRLVQMVDTTFSLVPETLLTVGYDATSGRVTEELEGPDNAAPAFPTHKFAWPAGQPVEYTDPRSTLNRLTLDAQGRVTRVEMNASTNADGMPREADNFTAYAQLVWQITYSQGCGCRLPLLIVTPENRQWTYAWDTARGLLLQVSSGNRSESWTYDTWSHGSIPLTYVDPAQKTWSTSYSFHSGTNAVSQATITTPQWTDAGGAGQTAITSVLSFSTRGRLTSIVDGEGTRTDFVYNGSTGMGRYFLQKVVHDPTGANLETLFTLDDLGRLKQVESGAGTGRVTTYVTNLYQMVEQTVRQVSTSPAYTIASEVYRDRRNNAMVARIENKPEQGGAARSRAWIVSEMRYDTMDRVVSIKRDSAAVDDASPLYLTHTLDYTPDHILTRVTLPHGAVNRYITDGYGLSYKTILDEGTGKLNVVPVRYFYNRDGDLTQVSDGNNHITTITVNAFGEPETVANPLDGLVRLTRDAFGRVTAQKGIKVQVPELVLTWSEQVFDELGQVKRSKRHLLDTSGNQVKTEETQYYYNKRSQVVRIDQPLGRGATIEYDSAGRPRLARDRLHASDPLLQNQVEFTYEAVTGRLWKRTSREVEAGDFGAQPGSGSQIDYVEQFTYDLMDRVLTSMSHLTHLGTGISHCVSQCA